MRAPGGSIDEQQTGASGKEAGNSDGGQMRAPGGSVDEQQTGVPGGSVDK